MCVDSIQPWKSSLWEMWKSAGWKSWNLPWTYPQRSDADLSEASLPCVGLEDDADMSDSFNTGSHAVRYLPPVPQENMKLELCFMLEAHMLPRQSRDESPWQPTNSFKRIGKYIFISEHVFVDQTQQVRVPKPNQVNNLNWICRTSDSMWIYLFQHITSHLITFQLSGHMKPGAPRDQLS